MKTIKFAPGDTNYRWDFSENSPFLKRNLTLFSHDKKIKAKFLNVKKRVYALFFTNEKEAYNSRNLNRVSPQSVKKEKVYIHENNLSGNTLQIRFSINRLLNRVIANFEADPHSLFAESARIKSICDEEDYTIPNIEAFYKIKNWEEFMQLLNSLRSQKSPFKFELLLAAITEYAALCEGG